MLFSERKGLSSIRSVVQKDDVDDVLRNGLWNAWFLFVRGKIRPRHEFQLVVNSNAVRLFALYWHDFFKLPIDEMPSLLEDAETVIRSYCFDCEWYEVYNFIEFTANKCDEKWREGFIQACNKILEKELSAYRFVDSQLVEITDDEEIKSIESAIDSTDKYSGARTHLRAALSFLSDRKSPDYRNSVKESISAVESLCVSISSKPKATLGAALNEIEKNYQLHPAFKKALSSLYG